MNRVFLLPAGPPPPPEHMWCSGWPGRGKWMDCRHACTTAAPHLLTGRNKQRAGGWALDFR